MPELPDVEGYRRVLADNAAGRPVRRVRAPDPDILRNTTPQGLGRSLAGRRLDDPERRGKWLLGRAGDRTLILHFGMSGALVWDDDPGTPGPHDRLLVELDGGRLTYRTQRKLGGVWLAGDGDGGVDRVEDVTGPLGPDALDVDAETFDDLLAGKKGKLKSALMDQELIAGIGNELSDEILWHARLDPRRPVEALSPDDRRRLHGAMHGVLRTSVRHGRIPRKEGWLSSVRGEEEPRCPRCGDPVRTSKVGGRTSYWCPSCQHDQ